MRGELAVVSGGYQVKLALFQGIYNRRQEGNRAGKIISRPQELKNSGACLLKMERYFWRFIK